MNCIRKYLSEYEELFKVATVATWLGNDETHYYKRFEDKDVSDLKKYIDGVVSYIRIKLLSKSASIFYKENK